MTGQENGVSFYIVIWGIGILLTKSFPPVRMERLILSEVSSLMIPVGGEMPFSRRENYGKG
jgi:hypothetical protein